MTAFLASLALALPALPDMSKTNINISLDARDKWIQARKEIEANRHKCAEDYGTCLLSSCCESEDFACYKRTTKEFAQCRPKLESCEDTKEWLCPKSWSDCTDSFGDCRTSLCCKHEKDMCVRRSQVYFAQCRPPPKETDKKPIYCTSLQLATPDTEWLCPGWEVCAESNQECTYSRCCAQKDETCVHDKERYQKGGGWHAYCKKQGGDSTEAIQMHSDIHTAKHAPSLHYLREHAYNFTVALQHNPLMCEGKSKDECNRIFSRGSVEFASFKSKLVHQMKQVKDKMSPVAFTLFLGSSLLAVCLVSVFAIVGILYLRQRALQAELKLAALKVQWPSEQNQAAEIS